MNKIRIGISACLLGQKVRYDGQHKHDHFITDTLGVYFDYVPVCPEVECGLGIPRESMHLEGDLEDPRLLTTRTRVDHTERMQRWARTRVMQLEKEGLCGFIFKSKSPSSGMMNVKVFNAAGGIIGRAPGLFAKAFLQRFPSLPCEDEGRLNDPDLRENFIERVFTLSRFRQDVSSKPSLKALMDFHARNKFLIQAHNEKVMREMGREVSQSKARNAAYVAAVYEQKLMAALGAPATPRKHANILQHMAGFLKKHIDQEDRREIENVIGLYRNNYLPLIVPVTLIGHWVRKHHIEYLMDQYYLNPHPIELKLRNHA